jgi:molybdopterin/thiamine biosynthesis adenylyltransferase
MDSRRHFLRGLARAATGAGGAAASTEARKTAADAAATEAAARPRPEAAPRYAAALADPAWGADAQNALAHAAVLVIGAGALGTPVLGYLAAAGVGRLGVLDHADVALSDLYAAIVHYTPDVGVAKARSAAVKLGFLNPEIVVEPYQVRLDAANAGGLLAGQDLVVDCSADAATREVIATTCEGLRIPLVSAGVSAAGGWVLSVPAGERACATCAGLAAGAVASTPATLAGVIGSLQAREALARIADTDGAAGARALHVDLDAPELRRTSPHRRAECSVCGWR